METCNFEGLPAVVGSKKDSPFMGESAAERPEGVPRRNWEVDGPLSQPNG